MKLVNELAAPHEWLMSFFNLKCAVISGTVLLHTHITLIVGRSLTAVAKGIA
jgi:hypothetical protein